MYAFVIIFSKTFNNNNIFLKTCLLKKYQFSADFIEIELNENKIEINSTCSSIKCEDETLNDLNMETFDLLARYY
jgi:hypothetical protein